MSSTAVKCASCNIVICELLSFVQNKIDVMDEDSISRLCISTYTKDEIVIAKNLLFDSVQSIKRKVTRKKDGKSQRDIEDIISLFKDTDPDKTPIFVSRDLNKLPPVTFDHIDASKLLKDLIILRDNMQKFEENYITKAVFNSLKKEVDNLKSASVVNDFDCFVNTKRGAGLYHETTFDSGPMGLPHIPHNAQTKNCQLSPQIVLEKQNESSHKQNGGVNSNILTPPEAANDFEQRRPCEVSGSPATQTSFATIDNRTDEGRHYARGEQLLTEQKSHNDKQLNHDLTYANILRENGNVKEQELWKLVNRRRPNKNVNRLSVKLGKAAEFTDLSFKAVENKVPILITNVHKETSEKDIIKYIHRKTQETVSLIQLSSRIEKRHNAYKIFVPSYKLHIFLDDSMWPKGIVFRRFINFKKKVTNEDSVACNKLSNLNGQDK